jgi:predicted O-methyltransferase YrrM
MKTLWNKYNKTFESVELNKQLDVNPWSGHRDFIYDLLVYLQPDTIVELGTHYGCSFFAMAQAIKDFNLETKLYGIDTWEGEEHAGKYGRRKNQICLGASK